MKLYIIKFFKENVNLIFYVLLFLLFVFYLFVGAKYTFASHADMFNNGLGRTWLKSLEINFIHLNGRWGQGISNDYRFYEFKQITIVFINVLLAFATYFFLKIFFNNKNAIILSIVITITIAQLVYKFYYHALYLPTANSYTVGFSLSLICYYLLFKMLSKEIENKNIYFLLALFIIIITSGLVELVSLPMFFILGALLLYLLIFEKKLNLRVLILFLTSLIGFLIVLLSPGSINRRNEVSEREGFSILNLDYNKFFDKTLNFISGDINIYSITALVLVVIIFISTSKKKYELTIHKKIYIVLVTLVYIITPMIIGFLASNGTEGMAKAYNMLTRHFVIGSVVIVLVLVSNIKLKIKNLFIITTLVYSIALIIYAYSFYSKSNIGDFISSINNNNLQELYTQEKARRYYLIAKKEENKTVNLPVYSPKYKTLPTYRAYNNVRMCPSFKKAFNNNNPVISHTTLLSPNSNYGVYLVENDMVKPSLKNENLIIYFIKEFNVLIIKNLDDNFQFDFRIEAYYNTLLKEQNKKTIYGSYLEKQLDDYDFYKDKNLIGIDLPHQTSRINLFINDSNRKPLVIDVESDMTLPKIEKFRKENVFSIMN
ncbi:hypothetical protein FG167_05570 [Lacinutrix sp. WUR7]|uniref:DUF6056 family protein n=1 Tax=Lacinutrix sp. WUR7 TaxID=2653681 RepID=UPI00193CBD89|nr:DUF6056 family protein [Lacinutrix sp. WUR7]QRM88722.1 hypothetical protein FG167_05570 [Lacinutrix sp. WUR7]